MRRGEEERGYRMRRREGARERIWKREGRADEGEGDGVGRKGRDESKGREGVRIRERKGWGSGKGMGIQET